MVTLHHFEHPLWFEDLGGFEKTENIQFFVQFALKSFNEFGALTKFWCTINEPEVYVAGAYVNGKSFRCSRTSVFRNETSCWKQSQISSHRHRERYFSI